MNEPPEDQAAEQASAAPPSDPSEEELRAQFEEQVRKIRMDQVLLQCIIDILNLSARRIAKEDERDLEQGKLGISAAQALIDLVPEEARADLRQAVSELQLLYAKQVEAPVEGADEQEGSEPEGKEAGPGLWTPPGS